MKNPYLLPRPARIAFSGGRTSAYMLYHVLEAFDFVLPHDVIVTFANTGKEREETLQFVKECTDRWKVDVRWLEYVRRPGPVVKWNGKRAVIACHDFREVTFETASRNGEPFEAIIDVKAAYRQETGEEDVDILPNVRQRWCSGEMKQRTMTRFMHSLGYGDYTVAVGMRADEFHRVTTLRNIDVPGEEYVTPLQAAGVMERDVMKFWREQPFDLQIKQYEGNCDLCFLKNRHKTETLIVDNPGMIDWWAAQEERTGATFARNRPSFLDYKTGRVPLRMDDDDLGLDNDTLTCFCTD